MKSLMIMNRDFTLRGELSQFTSLEYRRGYYDIGEFHLECSPGAACAEQLQQGVILFPPDAPHKLMLAEDIYQDDKVIKLDGVQLKGDAKKRLCVPPLSLPTTLYQYTGGQWTEITDEETIFTLMQGDVYEGYGFPDAPTEGMVFVDMTNLATVYDWESKTQTGETWLDLGVARLRSKYKNFGWDRYIGPAESALKHYIQNNMTAPEDEKRIMPGWIISDDQGRGLTLPWQARFDNLGDMLAKIGSGTGMGWDVTPDFANKRFVLDILKGQDLSQGIRRVVISTDMGNAENVILQKTMQNTYTTAYAGGAGEDEERLILTVGNELSGASRREMWADAGSVDDPEMITLNGQNKLTDAAPATTLKAQVIDSGACRYERDWNVGDIVIVRRRGAQTAARVLSVTEVYEQDSPRRLDVVFGDSKVTLLTVIKRLQEQVAR